MSLSEKKTPFVAETFIAKGETTQARYTVKFWQWKHELTTLDGSTQQLITGWKYETSTGQPVNTTDDGQFELAATGERLIRT